MNRRGRDARRRPPGEADAGPPTGVTINRHCLIDALHTLADAAAAIERHADHHHDHLISMVREVIYDLAMEIEASDLLS